ncbi:MAG: hypothetical protein ACJZ14_07175 [Candidatus Neomarinimicrobiota bacterium]
MSENQTDIFPGVAFSIGYKLTKGYTSKNKKEKKKLELNENKVNLENKINGSRATGNLKIDNFVNASFDLNDKVVDLKKKLNSVSDTLNESNKVLTEISKGSKGAWKVASNEVVKEFYKSKKNIISAAQLINSNVPNLPQLYFILLKEAMMDPNTLKEFAKGSELEEALILTFNNKAKKKGMPTISKEWINNLNLKLDPTKALESKLRKIKKKVILAKKSLITIPNDLEEIRTRAQSLLFSAEELPKAAESLGKKNSPKALKAIKNTTSILKNILNEVKSIGDETKKAVGEIDLVLSNIQNMLKGNSKKG